jgi:hypothetical protein
MAKYTEKGEATSPAMTLMPHMLKFSPTDKVKNLFSNAEPANKMQYLNDLKSVPKDSPLYDVFALTAPEDQGGNFLKIGQLVLDGTFTTSKWGDQHLFFRHQRQNDDNKVKPEWSKNLPTYKCPLGF